MQKSNFKFFAFTLFIFVLTLPNFSKAAVIFEDDFESEATDWECGDG